MATGFATSFDSFWGNSLQGIFINWQNTAVADGTIDGTTTLSLTCSLYMYGALQALDTQNADVTDGSAATFYVLFKNPYDKNDYDAALAEDTPRTIHYD